jgi:hypothetical protein
MRRKKAIKRGRWASVFVAAIVGYALGSWNAAAVRSSHASSAPTAAQAVALRFPSDFQEGTLEAPAAQSAAPSYQLASESTVVIHNANRALFVPEPMVPAQPEAAQAAEPAQPQEAAAEPISVQVADLSPTPPVAETHAAAAPILPKPRELASAPKPHLAAARRPATHHMFDDAQLASIKRRLNLTPDQEQMWPAVAVALRNIGAEREREARARGNAGEVNPDSPQVQDLKSAAIPLIMSFSDEQKDEVRTLARGMGLDQLASQF